MAFLKGILKPIADYALPPRCAGCGVVVLDDRQLCLTCWDTLDFLTSAGCDLCGCPSVADGMACATCLARPPCHDGAYAAVAYGELARTIVLKFKHGGRVGLASFVADAMMRHLPAGPLLIIPVPLHRWRIWNRGFNQSAYIAREIAKRSAQPLALGLLTRTRSTPRLRGLGAKARADAVKGVFAIDSAKASTVRGREIVLIDDVYTSGATTNACARVLKKAGAAKVIVLCWARVLIGD